LGNEVIGIGPRNEVRAVVSQHLLEGGVRLLFAAPQLFAPPLLRKEPARPNGGEGFEALSGRRGVVAILEGRVGSESSNLAFEAHHAVRIVLGCARGSHDAVGKGGVAHGPLKRLLRAHREANERAQVRYF
jgi:hypothetical protein